ncbi:MAG TPA: hypothetical protein HA230_00665 [Candidatus Aenigmarchaeota archaeon]|nr:hypothetical protein [Candidatus Aenigmarchaeota archaeon]
MFCIKCGRPAKIGNFCDACFLDSEELFAIKDFSMEYCDICGINQNMIKEQIIGSLKTKNNISNTKVSIKLVGNKAHATVTCSGSIKGLPKTETKNVMVIIRKKMCAMHVKLSGGYYEAVIQIRGRDKDNILKYATRLLPKKSISSIEKLKEGYNIKVLHKANAAAAVRGFRKRYEVKDSYKLAASKKGEMLYRNYYAIR